jgi:Chaperone of endosialidase
MCLFGGSQKSTSTYVPSDPALQQYQSAWNLTQQAAAKPFEKYNGAFTAGINPLQEEAIGQIRSSSGLYEPYFGQAQELAGRSAQPISVTPYSAEEIAKYQNPYTNQVIDATMQQLRQQQGQDMSKLQGNQLMRGAFGGSRSALNQADLARQQEMASAQTVSGLLNQGYQQAVGQFNQQQGLSLQQQEAERQNAMAAAGLYSGLGTSAQNFGLQNAQALMGAGSLEQQTEQNELNAQYNQFLAQQQYPFETAQFLTNAATGLGSLMGGTTTAKTPKPFFSDRRVKEHVAIIGKSYDGHPIYKFHYKGDPTPQIGFMAQDLEKDTPEAVGVHNGIKTLDYDAATHESARRGHFATGGAPGNSFEFTGPTPVPVGPVSYVPQSVLQSDDTKNNQPQAGNQQGETTSTMHDIASGVSDVANIAKGAAALFALSDERLKENIQPVGETFTGQKIYRYNYKGDPSTRMGMLAQEVETEHPQSVREHMGVKTVNYDSATKEDQKRGHFAFGGAPTSGAPISYVPTLTQFGSHGMGIPQVVPQKTTSTMDDLKKAYNDVSSIWDNTPKGAQDYIKSFNPLTSQYMSGNQAPSNMGGRTGFANGGDINADDEDAIPIPVPKPMDQPDLENVPVPTPKPDFNTAPVRLASLGNPAPLAPRSVSQMIGDSDDRNSAISAFLAGTPSMEGGPSGGVSSDRSAKPYGRYQINEGTWGDAIQRHPELGLKPEDRFDNAKQDALMKAHAYDLAMNLEKQGLPVTPSNLYESHFLGMGGGPKMTKAMMENPNDYAFRYASPGAIKGNDAIFFKKDGTPRTNAELEQTINRGLTSQKGWQLNVPLEGGNEPVPPRNIPESAGDLKFSSPEATGSTAQPTSNQQSMMDQLLTTPKEGLSPTQKALLTGLFGMLGSQNTTFLGSLGEGGLKGMQAYEGGQNQDIQRALTTAQAQKAIADAQIAQQNLSLEQQKFPYQIQNERMKIGLEGQKIAAQMASMFQQSTDPQTGQTVYRGPGGKIYSEDQVGKIYNGLLTSSLSSAGFGQQPGVAPPSAPALTPTPIEAQPTLAAARPLIANNETIPAVTAPAANEPSPISQSKSAQAPLNQKKENDFYAQHNVPEDQNPQALRALASKDRAFVDKLNQLPGLSPIQKQQLDDARKSAEDKEKLAGEIEGRGFTQDKEGNRVELTPLIEEKNKRFAEESYSKDLPKVNHAILDKSAEQAQAAKTIYATTQNIRNLMYDDKTNQFKFKTGSFEGTRSTISNMLATLGIDQVKDENGQTVSLGKMLTGVKPGDSQMLAHIMTMATPEMTKYQIPGQKFTQGELMQIANGNISADMLPKVILEMIDTQILPGTKYQIDKNNYLHSKSHNKATDDYQSLSNQYDEDHPITQTYADARSEFNKRFENAPSQSPFSETGKGVKLGLQNALGMTPTQAPPAASKPASSNEAFHMVNGHKMYLWPNGKYSTTPPSQDIRGD